MLQLGETLEPANGHPCDGELLRQSTISHSTLAFHELRISLHDRTETGNKLEEKKKVA